MRAYLRRRLSSPRALRFLLNSYRPYRGAAIQVTHIDADFRHARVIMRQRWYNKNYVGTHFGGSLYSMVDPMYMLLLMRSLGNDYIVWDKAASIDFIRPGKGTVSADFEITQARLADIKAQADSGERVLPTWDVDIKNEQGELVARVHKTLYVKKKAGR